MSAISLSARLAEERRFHDEQAAARWRDFAADPSRSLAVNGAWYLGHEPWLAPAIARLGDLSGKQLLDLGCGHGMASTLFAQRGAWVTGVDLSGGYVREAEERARCNGVGHRFRGVQAAGEALPFPAATFDAVWGHAILHHLELRPALAELRRVLRPGGIAVFCEPWGGNPVLEAARRFLPYPGKHRSRDEQPLKPQTLAVCRQFFPRVEAEFHQLLGMVRRALPRQPRLPLLDRLDRWLLGRFPALGRWCRYVVLELR